MLPRGSGWVLTATWSGSRRGGAIAAHMLLAHLEPRGSLRVEEPFLAQLAFGGSLCETSHRGRWVSCRGSCGGKERECVFD